MHQDEILQKVLDIEDLPSLPQVMERILETIEDENSSSKDLTEILELDHSISTSILRMANSAFYGLPSRVDSIRRAVVLLGFDTVRMLALATSVLDAFSGREALGLDPLDFWMHALGAAKAGQVIGRKHTSVHASDACFTGALLHDLGKFLLGLTLKKEYADICQEAAKTERDLCHVEMDRLKMTHAKVGAWVAEKWRFPAPIIDMIANQYKPTTKEAEVVRLADIVSRAADFGRAGDTAIKPTSQAVANNLGMTKSAVVDIVRELEELKEETRKILNLMM
jgi:HD-like signal output (HDOD) protein